MIPANKREAVLLLHRAGMKKRAISRLFQITPHSVRVIIRENGTTHRTARRDKIELPTDLLRRLHKECKGEALHIHEKLTNQEGFQVSYQTLTRTLRELGLKRRSKLEKQDEAEKWITEITHGVRSLEQIESEIDNSDDLADLLQHARNGRLKARNKALVVLARKRKISNGIIATVLHSAPITTRKYFKVYQDKGPSVLFGPNSPRSELARDTEKAHRVLEILHQKPSAFGINRTSWTQRTITQAYKTSHHETLSRRILTRLINKIGYRWKKARRVLTSPDPDYHEKLERLLQVLHSLAADEMFFFLDEWGPIQVKKRGGKAYRCEKVATPIPRRQKSKGTVTFVGALSATTNQMTWLFEPCKDTGSIIVTAQ